MMKKMGLSCFLLCASLTLSAQGYNYANGTYHTNIATSVAVGDAGQWIVAGYQGDYDFPTVYPYLGIAGFPELPPEEVIDVSVLLEDLSGELMWMSNMVFDSVRQEFYFILEAAGCDYGIAGQLITLSAIDGFPVAYELNDSYYGNSELSVIPGQGILLLRKSDFGPDRVELLDPVTATTTSLLHLSFNSDDASLRAEYWFEDHFLLHQAGTLGLYQFDDDGAEQTLTYASPSFTEFFILNDSTVLVQSNEDYVLLNRELEPLTTPEGPPFQLMAKDSLYYYGYAGDSIYFYQHDWQHVATVATDQGDYEVQSMAAYNGQVALVGSAFLPDPQYPFYREGGDLFFRTYTTAGPDLPATTDLAVESISTGGNAFAVPPVGGCMWGTIYDIEVVVKNNGTEPVESVTLSYEEDSCFDVFCPVWLSWTEGYYELHIPPGGSVSLTIDELVLGGLDQSNSLSICLRAHAWEGTTETDLSNNQACVGLAITDTDTPLAASALKVYPTLCQEELFVELPAGAGPDPSMAVYNALGQLVQEIKTTTSTDPVRIDVSCLPAGSYFLRLAGEVGQGARFIKN